MSTAKPRPAATRGGPAPAPSPAAAASDAPTAAAKPAVQLRKPVFTTIDKLLPQTHGHNLTARVLSSRAVLDKPAARTRVAECLVGDPTGTVLFTARNGQTWCTGGRTDGFAPCCFPRLLFNCLLASPRAI
ncbi:hypothetical protein ACQJBY_061597 [Aegilops geniculata]